MKIALCISGSLRNFKDTFYSFKEFILDKFNPDVFFYGPENKEGIDINLQDFNSLYKPLEAIIQPTNFYSTIPCKYTAPNIYYMAYNTFMCNNLKKEHENKNNFTYDLVIRARPDYFWFRSLTEKELQLAKTNILIPKEWAFKIYNECARCDMLAIGNSEMMDIYSSLYQNIDRYGDQINVHPETLCGFNLLTNNVSNIEIERPIIYEYPSKRTEKYIQPYKFTKYFEEPNIIDENQFLYTVSNKRRDF